MYLYRLLCMHQMNGIVGTSKDLICVIDVLACSIILSRSLRSYISIQLLYDHVSHNTSSAKTIIITGLTYTCTCTALAYLSVFPLTDTIVRLWHACMFVCASTSVVQGVLEEAVSYIELKTLLI